MNMLRRLFSKRSDTSSKPQKKLSKGEIREKIQHLQEREESLTRAFDRGVMTEDGWRSSLASIEKEIADLKRKL